MICLEKDNFESMPLLNGIEAARQLTQGGGARQDHLAHHALRRDVCHPGVRRRCIGLRPQACGVLGAHHGHRGGAQGTHLHHADDRPGPGAGLSGRARRGSRTRPTG